jgi:hypothetical protein
MWRKRRELELRVAVPIQTGSMLPSDILRRLTSSSGDNQKRAFQPLCAMGGDSVIAENVRDEQRKFIKYNHLVANLLVFHNLVTMTRAIRRMETDGHQISDEILAVLSPYQTAHINRFGSYSLNFGRDPKPIHSDFRKPPQSDRGRQRSWRSRSQRPRPPENKLFVFCAS